MLDSQLWFQYAAIALDFPNEIATPLVPASDNKVVVLGDVIPSSEAPAKFYATGTEGWEPNRVAYTRVNSAPKKNNCAE
jgi:hypothetical protein